MNARLNIDDYEYFEDAPVAQSEWQQPRPIKAELSAVKPLDPAIIPEPFRDWVSDCSHRMSCAPDGIAIAAIIAAGTVIGTACTIRPKRKDNWLCVPNLWGALVAGPSTKKSNQLLQGTEPLKPLEESAKLEYQNLIREYKIEAELFKNQQAGLSAMARGKKSDEQINEIRQSLLNLKEPEKPAFKRYIANDATIEKLNELLSENPRGIMMFRDELVGFLASMEQAGHEGDRSYFLEAWNGNASKVDDRIGRGTVIAPNVCVSILGGIQPDKIERYLREAAFGLKNDGFIQRFQLMVFPDQPQWKYVDEAPNEKARQRAFEVFDQLAKIDFKARGAKQNDTDKFPWLSFDDEAQQVYIDWLSGHKLRERSEQTLLMPEHLGKYESLMPSLALIFHWIEVADGLTAGPVTKRSAQNAIEWCHYLESHARRVYGLLGHVSLKAAANLADKIRTGELTDGFTVYDVKRKGWRFLTESDVIRQALEELVDLGWLQEQRTEPAFQQKAKVMYLINPKALGAIAEGKNV